MVNLGTYFDDASKNSNLAHIFLAYGCVLTGKQRLDELEAASGIEVVFMSLQEVTKALDDGEIKSMSSVAAGYKALSLVLSAGLALSALLVLRVRDVAPAEEAPPLPAMSQGSAG